MRNLIVFGMTLLSLSSTVFAAPSARQALMSMNEKILGSPGVLLTSMNYIGTTLNGEVCEIAVQVDHIHFLKTSNGTIDADDAFNAAFASAGMQDEATVSKYDLAKNPSAQIQTMEVAVASKIDRASAHFVLSRNFRGFASGSFRLVRGDSDETCVLKAEIPNFTQRGQWILKSSFSNANSK